MFKFFFEINIKKILKHSLKKQRKSNGLRGHVWLFIEWLDLLQKFHLLVRITFWCVASIFLMGNKIGIHIINGSHHLHLVNLVVLIIKVLCSIHHIWMPPCNFLIN
jgi:hypothetical protein